ncbi:hypothetical protein PRNP1_002044 [Phytophthora ramorum]
MVASESRGERQIHVLLTLLDGERSFGMSLAQKSPALGPKYTVVSSVFANSPAARAGVRQGYVVRYINDKPMGGLTVAQVANNFRNVAQASITLEIVDTVSPRTSAFTAAATFGGVSMNQAGGGQRSVAPVTGFSVVSSGRAIAAPGTALAGPRIAAPKQSVVRFGAKLAAKTTTGMAGSSNVRGKGGVMSDADAKLPNSARHTSLKSKAVAPVLRLGPTPKSVRSDIAAQKVAGSSAKQDAPKPAAKTVPGSSVAEKGDTSSRVPRSPIQAIETPKRSPGAQAEKAEQLKRVAAPAKAFVPRGRPRKNPVVTTSGSKGKAKKPQKQQEDEAMDSVMDDDGTFGLFAFSSDSDLEESPSKKTAQRTGKGRRRGVTDRTRHSLTIDRLLGMGFTQEDAEASVKEIGDDPDACMIWIISKIEERSFNEDLNRASIQSEQSKRDEEKRLKKLEKETIAHAEKFMSNFSTSYIVSADSSAAHLKIVLESTIDQVDADNYLREILTKLLTLEGKSIRWYKQATRSYMLGLAGRLETALGSHDVMTCCSRASASDASSSNGSCAFVRKILEEEKELTKALFEMPTNQGGVPPVFLECDEATKFDLEDDGFEVVDE